jgi:hypothetical protein
MDKSPKNILRMTNKTVNKNADQNIFHEDNYDKVYDI